MIVRVLTKTGATVQERGTMYKVVAQSVLLYGSERDVVTGEMLKLLEGIHHRVAMQITGMAVTCEAGEEW